MVFLGSDRIYFAGQKTVDIKDNFNNDRVKIYRADYLTTTD